MKQMFAFLNPVEWLTDQVAGILRPLIRLVLDWMYGNFDGQLFEASSLISQNPKGWNAIIFEFMQTIHHMVIVPVGVVIIAFVLLEEMWALLGDSNSSMTEVLPEQVFKVIFKAVLGVEVMLHSFTLVMWLFDVGSWLVTNAATVFIQIDEHKALESIQGYYEALDHASAAELMFLFALAIPAFIINIVMICMIWLVVYSRLIEMYLYASMSSIPLATYFSKRYGNIADGYMKNVLAIMLQGVIMLLCMIIYRIMVSTVTHTALTEGVLRYLIGAFVITGLLFKSKAMAKGILGMG